MRTAGVLALAFLALVCPACGQSDRESDLQGCIDEIAAGRG
jgi:hypothetical protein